MALPIGKPGDAEPDVMIEMNATPLIDVMMVLLIMLIITIPAQLHSVNLDMPATAATPPAKPVVVQVEVDARSAVRWNGQALASPGELEARLREAAAQQPQPELHLRAHAKAKYEAVAAVMAGAQRQSLHKIGVLGAEQFGD